MNQYRGIPGWYDFEKFHDFIVDKMPEGARMVECGVLFGASATGLVDKLEKKQGFYNVFLIDRFDTDKLGAPGRAHCDALGLGHLSAFYHHAELTDLLNRENVGVYPMRFDSARIDDVLRGEKFDFAFIDTEHTHVQIMKEVRALEGMLQPRAILAGHDFIPDTYTAMCQWLENYFGDRLKIFPDSTCWYVEGGF